MRSENAEMKQDKELEEREILFEKEMEEADAESSSESECDSDEDGMDEWWGVEEIPGGVNLKDGKSRGSSHSMPYYMASLKMVMEATPQVVRKLQKSMIEFMLEVCPDIDLAGDWQEQLMAERTLKVRGCVCG